MSRSAIFQNNSKNKQQEGTPTNNAFFTEISRGTLVISANVTISVDFYVFNNTTAPFYIIRTQENLTVQYPLKLITSNDIITATFRNRGIGLGTTEFLIQNQNTIPANVRTVFYLVFKNTF